MDPASTMLPRPKLADAWPRTRRPLPWLIAAFLAMIFLVPFEAIHLDVSLPFGFDLDRLFVLLLVGAWAIGWLTGAGDGALRLRSRGWATGMAVFLFVAVASVAVNVERITNVGEWDVAQKRLAVLLGLAAVFAIVATGVRVAELRRFGVLIVVLAAVAAAGTIHEQRSGQNLFYEAADRAFSGVATVDPPRTDVTVDPRAPSRPEITGPTRHALSMTTILGMALPFAVVFAAGAPSRARRLLWGLAACLIVAGALVTQRKSGVVVPVVGLLALVALRPRRLLRLAPFAVVAVVVGLLVAGGSFSSVDALVSGRDKDSTAGRTSDYPALTPDLLSNPLLGRGYGTLDTNRIDTYRILDNEYLGQLYQVGALGLLAFLGLILTPLIVARRVIRSEDPMRGPPALAAAAGCLAFAASAALYDVLSFSEAPYLFLVLAGFCVCAAAVEVPAAARQRPSPRPAVLLPADA